MSSLRFIVPREETLICGLNLESLIMLPRIDSGSVILLRYVRLLSKYLIKCPNLLHGKKDDNIAESISSVLMHG